MAASMLAASSCTDYSDYNEAPVDGVASANQTLWENILQRQDLSNFRTLVQQAGFDTELANSRAYTVWAPVDGSFDMTEFQGLSKEDLLKQFVKNHVADYSHQASGTIDERVHTLNEKSYSFTGNGSYTFGGLEVKQANLPGTNGLMHLVNGAVHFYPNLYEYLSVGADLDSLRDHVRRYEVNVLDQDKSVKGPMVNGIQTYIDSVMITYNTLTRQLNASIENEDSSYTVLLPTNKAFMGMYNKVQSNFNFINETTTLDVENFAKADATSPTKTAKVDAKFLRDSLTRRAIMRNLFYSNKDGYNRWLVEQVNSTDTLRSTTRTKISNPEEVLNTYRVGTPVDLSNGYAHIQDSLAFFPWETYNPELDINPAAYVEKVFNGSAHMSSVPDSLLKPVFGEDFEQSSYYYLWVDPSSPYTKPDIFVSLPDVLSTTYNIYVVFMPTARREFGNEPKPSWLNFQISYTDEKNKIQTYHFSKAYADSLQSGGKLPDPAKGVTSATAFTNDPQRTDSLFIGRLTFPVCYKGLGDEYYPVLHISSPISPFNQKQMATYTRDVRIAAIILKPVELDEYEANNNRK